MFAARYFPTRYFARRYFPAYGAEVVLPDVFMGKLYPPSFAQSPDGKIFAFTGDRNARKWDGLLSDFIDAGVPAPTTACTVGSSTSGTICGRIYAYTRFLDADGNVSDLSPVSSVHNIGVTTGTITGATNAGPISITSASHGLSTGQTVLIDNVIGNYAANGVWVITSTGTNTFTLDGSSGSGTYVSGGTWRKGAGQIDYTSVPTTTDTRVAKKQILRSKDGDASTFYVDVETTSLATTSFSSTNTDAQLTNAVALIDLDGRDLNVASHSEPPNWKRFGAMFRGRLWIAGHQRYDQGGISLTNGSATVVGLQTNWTSAMVGWELFPLGTSNTTSYTVQSINTSTQTITLDSNYAGTTEAYLHYALVPPILNSNGGSEDRTIYFSIAGITDAFNLTRSLTFEESGQGEITGLLPFQNNLYVGFDRAIYRVIYSVRPESDAQVRSVANRGVINNRCWRVVDNTIFAMDRRGCYTFTEAGVQDISQQIVGLFNGEYSEKIEWRKSEYFHCIEFPEDRMIKWFVVIGGGMYPKHAICFSLNTGRWWMEEYALPVTASTLGVINGSLTPLISIGFRQVAAVCHTSTEGIPGDCTSTLRGTATSAGVLTLVDTAATFTSDVVGTTVRIVEGTGKGQVRNIVNYTATTLYVKHPWSIKPSTDSVYQIGGVHWKWRSGAFRWIPSEDNQARSTEVVFEPTDNSHHMSMKRYVNYSALPENNAIDLKNNGVRAYSGEPDSFVDTTDQYGFGRAEYSDARQYRVHGRETVRVELEGTTNNESLSIYGVAVEGASK